MPEPRRRQAFIVVDVQNDFADPKGTLHVPGGHAVIPAINRETARARAAGDLVVYSQDWHPVHTPHFARDGGPWPVHCVAGTWGAELHPDLHAPVGAPLIRKGTNGEDGYSAFTMLDTATGRTVPTPLGLLLFEAGITDVTIAGVATDYCVRATALDSVALGYSTTVLTDAVAAVEVHPGDGERAMADMRAAGVHLRASTQR
jgi:nicotinamidase/pyrazinamidase